jgi:hypothetical protein
MDKKEKRKGLTPLTGLPCGEAAEQPTSVNVAAMMSLPTSPLHAPTPSCSSVSSENVRNNVRSLLQSTFQRMDYDVSRSQALQSHR